MKRYFSHIYGMCATTAEMLRGAKVWVPTPGRLRPAPGQRLGARGRPITPGKFLKT